MAPHCCPRRKTLEALSRSAIHQSLMTPTSRVAMARCRSATLNDPVQAMELLRSLIQPAINAEVRRVMQRFADDYFLPAAANALSNLDTFCLSERLVDDVCISALDHAKEAFKVRQHCSADLSEKKVASFLSKRNGGGNRAKGPELHDVKKYCGGSVSKRTKSELRSARPNTDLILVSKTGKPVRREGPKWEPKRFTKDSLFILGSKANKALGFGQTRGRLYIKHPELFKYSGDQEDKEWLARNQLMSTTGGKAYLMVLGDILELARSPDYSSHPRQQPNELMGFTAPAFMLNKMRCFASTVRTSADVQEDALIEYGERQMMIWEEERKKLITSSPMVSFLAVKEEEELEKEDSKLNEVRTTSASPPAVTMSVDEEKQKVEEILNEIKTEGEVVERSSAGTVSAESGEDELGFLHGMNLTNLVREFEMEAATANGTQNLDILSLADDNVEGSFPELSEDPEDMVPKDGGMDILPTSSGMNAGHPGANGSGEMT